jgi:uncharacterized protein (DUF885 family)
MTRFSQAALVGLVFFWLAACGAAPTPPAPQAADPAEPRERLSRIVDRYWDEHVFLANPISPQSLADSLAVERHFLAEVLSVPRDRLDVDSRLTYDIFRRQRELAIEGFTYPAELLPVNPFAGMPQQLARLAADAGPHPLQAAKDYEAWLRRIDDYVLWTRQAIANMRDGMRRGYTSPRVLMERMLPLLQGLGEDTSANVFYLPVRTPPEGIPDAERTRLTVSLTSAVKDKLLPAFRELHDFIRDEYLPRARVGVALSALPLGPSWYAYRLKLATSTQLTPNEIHGIGMAEVERIRARLQSIPSGAPPAGAGDAPNAITYQDLKAQTLAAMPALFSAVPEADFETATNVPQPASMDIVSFLREEIPGRRYQSTLQHARADLPRFRRFGSEPAFVDGWALYAASLGEELGLYRDDAAKRNALLGQLRCAVALVADTGIHAQGWTRVQAVDYLRAQLAAGDADADQMADRFVALPGDALACMVGKLRIQALLAQAQHVQGARFDIREFHSEILKDGAMPLDILEAKMKLWLEVQH